MWELWQRQRWDKPEAFSSLAAEGNKALRMPGPWWFQAVAVSSQRRGEWGGQSCVGFLHLFFFFVICPENCFKPADTRRAVKMRRCSKLWGAFILKEKKLYKRPSWKTSSRMLVMTKIIQVNGWDQPITCFFFHWKQHFESTVKSLKQTNCWFYFIYLLAFNLFSKKQYFYFLFSKKQIKKSDYILSYLSKMGGSLK